MVTSGSDAGVRPAASPGPRAAPTPSAEHHDRPAASTPGKAYGSNSVGASRAVALVARADVAGACVAVEPEDEPVDAVWAVLPPTGSPPPSAPNSWAVVTSCRRLAAAFLAALARAFAAGVVLVVVA